MLDFLTADQNIPFAVAAVLLIVLFVVELVGFLMGVSVSELIEGADGPDFGIGIDGGPDADIPAGEGVDAGAFAKAFDWLNIGRVPIIILLVVFLAMFVIVGYLVQSILLSAANFMLPWPIAVVPALLLALPATRSAGRVIGRYMPKDESDAVPRESLIGLTAVIVLGRASQGKPAQGKARDKFGTTHYLMVEPDVPGEEFSAGQEVLLVRSDSHKFYAIAQPATTA